MPLGRLLFGSQLPTQQWRSVFGGVHPTLARSAQKRFFSGGAAKPGWRVAREHRFGPTLPDHAYYGEHATFNYFVLFIRGMRPYLEKVLGDCALTIKNAALAVYRPVTAFVVKHNPELRLQFVAFASFMATHMAITKQFNDMYQRLVDVTSLLELQAAQLHASEGFWESESEQQEARLQRHAEHMKDLETTWEEALREATLSRNFDILVRSLSHGLSDGCGEHGSDCTEGTEREGTHGAHAKAGHGASDAHGCFGKSGQNGIPPSLMWNFNAMPYGKDNPDTKTFPIPDHEQPYRAFSLGFTANNLSGNWGDYIDRQDNKNALMRPARMMFTDVFIPTTK
ncbi:conserved hypothetical protein [Neospora caninum Liverpool]|uniref:Uncharacterized protein n=1 Tax=Neospora caninum (strain Liverpool) TaxID=572307 RepID=F0VFU6_NEOCL|nr:conserved hypothetical protein [Neospora caninum Liverpool]CBZ52590.1 conserved hypothetical protein [Neospora caninum Liverpool]CEL66568.1 TPA: hypothetical protein BN1204_023790 [Neospora caninum Liverpool]|eukprot:XP_003882622.1 conserved hypothetical protein [Neospora caninum Liverpool]